MGQCSMEPEVMAGPKAMSQMKIKGKKKERKKEAGCHLTPEVSGLTHCSLMQSQQPRELRGCFWTCPGLPRDRLASGAGTACSRHSSRPMGPPTSPR